MAADHFHIPGDIKLHLIYSLTEAFKPNFKFTTDMVYLGVTGFPRGLQKLEIFTFFRKRPLLLFLRQ